MDTPQITNVFGLDDDGILAVAFAEVAAEDAERAASAPSASMDDLVDAYDRAVLGVFEGDTTMVTEVERLEGEIAQRELEQRRAVAAKRAEVARVARQERERVAREKAVAEALQAEARAALAEVEGRLEKAAAEFAKVAAEAMALGVQAFTGSHANQAGPVAELLKRAVAAHVAHPQSRWLYTELGGGPAARSRPIQ